MGRSWLHREPPSDEVGFKMGERPTEGEPQGFPKAGNLRGNIPEESVEDMASCLNNGICAH